MSENYLPAELFVKRQSLRVMLDKPIDKKDIMTLFEAARWAPSSWNEQPWRFVYVQRGMAEWDSFYNLLADANKKWAYNADVLVVVLTKTVLDYDGSANKAASYDVGAACQNLALQAYLLGLVAHPVAGFDYAAAGALVEVPKNFNVEVMFVIGHAGPPPEKRSGRKQLEELAFSAKFNG